MYQKVCYVFMLTPNIEEKDSVDLLFGISDEL